MWSNSCDEELCRNKCAKVNTWMKKYFLVLVFTFDNNL